MGLIRGCNTFSEGKAAEPVPTKSETLSLQNKGVQSPTVHSASMVHPVELFIESVVTLICIAINFMQNLTFFSQSSVKKCANINKIENHSATLTSFNKIFQSNSLSTAELTDSSLIKVDDSLLGTPRTRIPRTESFRWISCCKSATIC